MLTNLYKLIFGQKTRKKLTWKYPAIKFNELESNQINYFKQIYNAEIDGFIVKNFIDIKNAKLKKLKVIPSNVTLDVVDFGSVIGKTLDGCDLNDLNELYFNETKEVNHFFNSVTNTVLDSRLKSFFYNISNKKEAITPKHNEDSYKSATVRIVEPLKKNMRPHIGNEFIRYLPQEKHMVSIIDDAIRFSFFIVLQKPTSGGILKVYDLTWNQTPKDLVENKGVQHKLKERQELLSTLKSKAINLEAGDLIIFDGGRIWHEVSNVLGDKNRITIGGFAAYSKNHNKIYFWS